MTPTQLAAINPHLVSREVWDFLAHCKDLPPIPEPGSLLPAPLPPARVTQQREGPFSKRRPLPPEIWGKIFTFCEGSPNELLARKGSPWLAAFFRVEAEPLLKIVRTEISQLEETLPPGNSPKRELLYTLQCQLQRLFAQPFPLSYMLQRDPLPVESAVLLLEFLGATYLTDLREGSNYGQEAFWQTQENKAKERLKKPEHAHALLCLYYFFETHPFLLTPEIAHSAQKTAIQLLEALRKAPPTESYSLLLRFLLSRQTQPLLPRSALGSFLIHLISQENIPWIDLILRHAFKKAECYLSHFLHITISENKPNIFYLLIPYLSKQSTTRAKATALVMATHLPQNALPFLNALEELPEPNPEELVDALMGLPESLPPHTINYIHFLLSSGAFTKASREILPQVLLHCLANDYPQNALLQDEIFPLLTDQDWQDPRIWEILLHIAKQNPDSLLLWLQKALHPPHLRENPYLRNDKFDQKWGFYRTLRILHAWCIQNNRPEEESAVRTALDLAPLSPWQKFRLLTSSLEKALLTSNLVVLEWLDELFQKISPTAPEHSEYSYPSDFWGILKQLLQDHKHVPMLKVSQKYAFFQSFLQSPQRNLIEEFLVEISSKIYALEPFLGILQKFPPSLLAEPFLRVLDNQNPEPALRILLENRSLRQRFSSQETPPPRIGPPPLTLEILCDMLLQESIASDCPRVVAALFRNSAPLSKIALCKALQIALCQCILPQFPFLYSILLQTPWSLEELASLYVAYSQTTSSLLPQRIRSFFDKVENNLRKQLRFNSSTRPEIEHCLVQRAVPNAPLFFDTSLAKTLSTALIQNYFLRVLSTPISEFSDKMCQGMLEHLSKLRLLSPAFYSKAAETALETQRRTTANWILKTAPVATIPWGRDQCAKLMGTDPAAASVLICSQKLTPHPRTFLSDHLLRFPCTWECIHYFLNVANTYDLVPPEVFLKILRAISADKPSLARFLQELQDIYKKYDNLPAIPPKFFEELEPFLNILFTDPENTHNCTPLFNKDFCEQLTNSGLLYLFLEVFQKNRLSDYDFLLSENILRRIPPESLLKVLQKYKKSLQDSPNKTARAFLFDPGVLPLLSRQCLQEVFDLSIETSETSLLQRALIPATFDQMVGDSFEILVQYALKQKFFSVVQTLLAPRYTLSISRKTLSRLLLYAVALNVPDFFTELFHHTIFSRISLEILYRIFTIAQTQNNPIFLRPFLDVPVDLLQEWNLPAPISWPALLNISFQNMDLFSAMCAKVYRVTHPPTKEFLLLAITRQSSPPEP